MTKFFHVFLVAVATISMAAPYAQAQTAADKKKTPAKQIMHQRYAAIAVQTSAPLFVSASVNQDWLFGKKNRIVIGGGLRFTTANGKSAQFITAPAILTSGKQGPGVFFADQIPANIDSLAVGAVQSNFLNLSGNIGYRFTKRLSAGFNIDIAGFSFGAAQRATKQDLVVSTQPIYSAKPTSGNLLLISDNDIGNLNSEIYARYNFKSRFSARAGLGFAFTEYTTTTIAQVTPAGVQNSRFRNKAAGLMLGVTYSF
jgi:hypothetical protein